MGEEKKKPCCCRGVAAIIIAVLTLLGIHGTVTGLWASIVILVLAVMIAIGSFAGCCCCAKFCKTKEGECCEPPAEQPPTE